MAKSSLVYAIIYVAYARFFCYESGYFLITGGMKMKYKWRRICAITGMIALCLFTPDIAEGNNSQDFESGTDIKSEISKDRMLDIIQDISAAPRPVKRAL